MKNQILILVLSTLSVISCNKDEGGTNVNQDLDKFVLVTNITSAATPTGYIGTLKDLNAVTYTNNKAQQFTSYPFISIFGNDVFACQNRSGDQVVKFTRGANGLLTESGRITMPPASQPMHVLVESSTRAYCSLYNAGKIAVFNPTTLQQTEVIDLTKYAKGDGSPDPGVMAFRNGKLYVACTQTTDTYTSDKPAELLIIDTKNNNAVVSTTDNRTSFCGNLDTPSSLFFDEKGDLYVYSVASWGYAPGQKAGWLRVKNGESVFDKSYFFNTTDYKITGIKNESIDYLQHPAYLGNGIVFSCGNVPALASNPPDYVKDRTFGAFKVDLINQTITKLEIPFSNGYAASVLPLPKENKVLFGMAAESAVGIFEYNTNTNTAASKPIVTVQGDPSVIETFEK